jgi:hypothetical protein
MITRGELGPTVLIKGNILTDDEWRTIDNVWIFHKCSPEKYPYGKKLEEQMEIKRRRDVQKLLIAARCNDYRHGNLIEESYYLEPLDWIIRLQDVLGVSRLFYFTRYEPEKIFTFVFKTNVVRIEAVEGATSLWASLPKLISGATSSGLWDDSYIRPFHASQQLRETGSLDNKDLPKPIRSWGDLVAASSEAGEFKNPNIVIGGHGFRHKVEDAETSIDVKWHNPRPDNNPAQNKLILWYQDCTGLAGLKKFWEHTHFERMNEERLQMLEQFREWAIENYPEFADQAWNDDGSPDDNFKDYKTWSRIIREWETDVKGLSPSHKPPRKHYPT